VGWIRSQVNGDQPGDRGTAPRLIVDASVSHGAGGGVYDERTGRLLGLVEEYGTARVSCGGDARYIDVPVPGETDVVPLAAIRRFLVPADRQDLLGTFGAAATTRHNGRRGCRGPASPVPPQPGPTGRPGGSLRAFPLRESGFICGGLRGVLRSPAR